MADAKKDFDFMEVFTELMKRIIEKMENLEEKMKEIRDLEESDS